MPINNSATKENEFEQYKKESNSAGEKGSGDEFSQYKVDGYKKYVDETVNKVMSKHYSRIQKVEESISNRTGAFENLGEYIKNIEDVAMPKGGPISQAIRSVPSAQVAMPISDIYGQVSESPLSNIAVNIAEDPIEFAKNVGVSGLESDKISKNIIDGLTGKKRSEFGDVLRISGVPEPIAAAGGLVAASFLDPFSIKQKIVFGAANKIDDALRGWSRERTARSPRTVTLTENGKNVQKRVYARNVDQLAADLKKSVNEKYSKLSEEAEYGITELKSKKRDLISRQADLASKVEADKILTGRAITNNMSASSLMDTLQDFYRRNSAIYKKRIDDISVEMEKDGNGFGMNDMSEVLENVKSYAVENGLVDSPVYKKIAAISKRYGSESDNPVNFKQMFNDYKMVRDSGDVIDPLSAKFSYEWSNAASKKSPLFRQLQMEYAPIMETKEYTRKALNLFGNKFDTKAIENFIERASKGDLGEGEMKLLAQLSKNNPGFSEGIGGIMENALITRRANNSIDKIAATEKNEIERELNLVDMAIERKEAGANLRKIELLSQKNKRLAGIEDRRRMAKLTIKNSDRFKKNQNWVRGIGASILIYELVTRPVRGALYKLQGGYGE